MSATDTFRRCTPIKDVLDSETSVLVKEGCLERLASAGINTLGDIGDYKPGALAKASGIGLDDALIFHSLFRKMTSPPVIRRHDPAQYFHAPDDDDACASYARELKKPRL